MRRGRRSRVRDSIEVRSPAVDAEGFVRAIESNLAARRQGAKLGYIPTYDDLLDSESELACAPRTEAEYFLDRLRRCDVSVTIDVRPSGVPLFGPLLDRFKRQFHNLVLYYVNIHAAKQAHYNAHAFRLAAILSRQIRGLRAELDRAKAPEGKGLPEKHGKL